MTVPASPACEDHNTVANNTDPSGVPHPRPMKEARIHKRRRVDIAAIFTPRGNTTSNPTDSGTPTPSSTPTSRAVPAMTAPISLGNTLAPGTAPAGSASDDEPPSPSALIRQSGAPAVAGFVGTLSSQLQLSTESRLSLHDFATVSGTCSPLTHTKLTHFPSSKLSAS
jgi:hypothetical protein